MLKKTMTFNPKNYPFAIHRKMLLVGLLFCLLITYACKPEKNSRDPSDYELYISVSADKYPVISPDGSLIAYSHQHLEGIPPDDYPTGLYIMDVNGNSRKLIVRGLSYSSSWSPDSKWLTFSADGVIKIINLDGAVIRTFEGINNVPLLFPDWSSDGKKILMNSPYVVGGGVFISNPDLGPARQLFDQVKLSGFGAKWTHNMEKLIYEKVSQEWSGGEIYLIDTLGINDLRITNDNVDDRYPVLSSINDLIAWSRNVQITIMGIDGTKRKMLDYGQNPSWSPGSDYLVYSNANQDFTKEVLWKINIDGSNKIQLTY
jgi:Tol biopolymer transport system component